ncbi:MAG: thiamine diphosphokinase [Pseudomonadota bacterium]
MATEADTRYAILLGGDVTASQALKKLVPGRRVIAADGGIRHARHLGCDIELWVGDFDSASASDHNQYAQVSRLSYDPEKSDTDGALAIAEAKKRGATDIVLVGALGGRSDHTFALMTQAIALYGEGLDVVLTDGVQFAVPLGDEEIHLALQNGDRFSVLGFTEMQGLNLHNAKWPLVGANVPFGSTLTISNEAQGPVTASLAKGRALLIWSASQPDEVVQ